MNTLLQDLRYGIRMLAKSPGFAAIAILTLALGIGANTAIFSIIDAVMLRSLPVRNPGQLVVLKWQAHNHWSGSTETSSFGDCGAMTRGANPSGCTFPSPIFKQIRAQVGAFSDVAAFAGPAHLELSGNGVASFVEGEIVSGNYFSALGLDTILGRPLGSGDDSLSASPAVVLSYAYWQNAFGGSKGALGRTILLNNVPFTIVGVAAPNVGNISPGKTLHLFLPIAMVPRLGIDWGKKGEGLHNWWLVILGRLKRGVSLQQAQAAATVVFRDEVLHGEKSLSKPQDDPRIVLVRAQEGLTGRRGVYSKQLYVLMFAVGMILLIACANVAGLLLSRAATRQKEMAVRLALGAGRTRVLRQLLTESLMLSLAGGAVGVLLAYWGVHIITALISRRFPFAVSPDWRVLSFVLGASILTGILFGLAPALRGARVDLTPALKDNVASAQGRSRALNLGGFLVMAQVALSVVILTGAGLLVRTLENLKNINPGFDTRNVLLFDIDPALMGYKQAQMENLYTDLRDRLAALPGVVSVSYSADTLLSDDLSTSTVDIEGQPHNHDVPVDIFSAGPRFLHTMRIPLLEGRAFTPADFEQAAPKSAPATTLPKSGQSNAAPAPVPVLVNKAFLRRFFANQNPLGGRIAQGHGFSQSGHGTINTNAPSWQIVGVIGDTKYNNLRRAIHPTIYVPFVGGSGSFELRTATDPASLIPAVRSIVDKMVSNLALSDLRTQQRSIDDLLIEERFVARLSGFFAMLALGLACIGLYGLLSYEVARRTREIGIRMALGAQQRDVLRLVVGQGIILAAVGAGVGVGVAMGVTRYMASMLFDVHANDPVTIASVAILLLLVALAACYIPARRATRVDPMVALRYE